MKRVIKTAKILTAALLFTIAAFSLKWTAAAEPAQMTVRLRIEGITQNFYSGELTIPYTDGLSASDVLLFADAQSDELSVTGADTGFLSDVNGDVSGAFGGWDGWLFKVNGSDPAVGILDYVMQEGDELLFYYGDPFGAGMQFPQADLSRIGEGILRFTSTDTTYDENFNPVTSVNPVAGAEVTWYDGGQTTAYTTDASGEIRIAPALLTEGPHKVQIAKTGSVQADGIYLPLVLRFAPDYTVEIQAASSVSSSDTSSAVSASEPESMTGTDDNPGTGDTGWTAASVMAAAAVLFLLGAALRKHPAGNSAQ